MSSETAIRVVWALGLVAAVGLTAVVLKLLFLLLRTLDQLRELAEWTAEAASGLAGVYRSPLRIDEATDATEGLRSAATALQTAAAGVHAAVDGPPSRGEERGEERDEEREVEGTSGAGELGGAAGGPPSGPGGS